MDSNQVNRYVKIFNDFAHQHDFNDNLDYYRNSIPDIHTTYAILFTPRSGSTYLAHSVQQLDLLSFPDEYFNILTLNSSLKFNPSRTITEYRNHVARRVVSSNKIFGFELSGNDLRELIKIIDISDLMIGKKYFIYLRRKNIIAQSISLYFAIETGVYHYTNKSNAEFGNIKVEYDSLKIKNILFNILKQEYVIGSFLKKIDKSCLEIFYEDMEHDIDITIRKIIKYIEFDKNIPILSIKETIIKPVNKLKVIYENKFRDEYKPLVDKLDSFRQSL